MDVVTNKELATTLIVRLNQIAIHDSEAMGNLIESRVACNEGLADHPSVQVQINDDKSPVVGMLGILNGLVGKISDGPKKGFGLITAVFDDSNKFVKFKLTEEIKSYKNISK